MKIELVERKRAEFEKAMEQHRRKIQELAEQK
jgi:hypothetical protein